MLSWIGWIAFYIYTLARTYTMVPEQPWLYGIIWYILGSVPALAEGIQRMVLNNVHLYEPVRRHSDPENPTVSTRVDVDALGRALRRDTVELKTFGRLHADSLSSAYGLSGARYVRRRYATGAHTWLRIAKLQLHGSPYRLLVHQLPPNPWSRACNCFIVMVRMAIFIWGSLVQGKCSLLAQMVMWLADHAKGVFS